MKRLSITKRGFKAITLLVFLSINTHAQNFDTSSFLFIGKKAIEKMAISEIKVINKSEECYDEDSLGCFEVYVFDSGRLKKHIIYDNDDFIHAENCAYNFVYINPQSNQLFSRYGNGRLNCGALEKEYLHYTYKAGRLNSVRQDFRLFLDGEFGRIDTIVSSIVHKYLYNVSGQLIKSEFEFDKNYIYKDNILVGYYSEVNISSAIDNSNKSDSIYYNNKISELKKIGFDAFSAKYLKGEVLNKVIDDCYTPVKPNQLLINGKTITEFLATKDYKNKQYFVMEIADNYFLFYKIVQ